MYFNTVHHVHMGGISKRPARLHWSIAEARRGFSDVVRSAAREPQALYNRGRVVAIVVAPDEFEQFRRWKAAEARPSIARAFSDLRTICRDEGYELEVGPRRDRPSPFDEEP